MLPLETFFCPCCTIAMLYSLSQDGSWLASQPFLELGKGALLSRITKIASSPEIPVKRKTYKTGVN